MKFNTDFEKYDLRLLAIIALAVVFGAIMVFSSSVIMADIRWASPYKFFLKQVIWTSIGFIAMFITAFFIDYRLYQKYSKAIYMIALLAVIGVLFFGVVRGGAKRWFAFGLFTFQPSELAKIAIIIIMADFIARKKDFVSRWEGLIAPTAYLLLITIPIALEPDLGAPVLIAGVCFAMLFCAGIKMQAVFVFMAAGALLIAEEIIRKPYRLARMRDYINSFINIDIAPYQVKQSLYALGSGGLFGKGLGKSEMKLMYLPEAHTDFIFPIIGEELGFIMTSIVIIFFMYIFFKGLKISKNAPDVFGEYLALGITCLIVFQALINLSVTTGLLPAKGLPLPFISFGGTSLIINMAAAGILINLSQYTKKGLNR